MKSIIKINDYSQLPIEPFPHQIEAANFLLTKKKGILADEMGAGKTMGSILAMDNLRGKKLIVCPASLKLNWKKEIEKVSSSKIHLISGKRWNKIKVGEWVIINYDILKNHMESIKKEKFKVATFDEVHYCKSINNNGYGGTKRARYFIQICNLMEYVFLLTGTPITNKTKDIFNLLKAIKHPLSKNFKEFAKRFCDPQFNGFGWTYDGSSNQSELNKKLQPYMLRRLKSELLDLPLKTRNFIPVDINIKEYNNKVDEYMKSRSSLGTKNEHLVYLNAMKHILAKEKVKHTIKLTENLLSQDKSVVIFTNYTSVVQSLKKTFIDAVTVTGSDSEKDRERAIDLFQNGEAKVIICNLISGGVGITLTTAKNTIINDLDWSPSNHIQAEERIYRIGQNENVVIDYVYSIGTVDEHMAQLLETKLVNINKIIDDSNEGFIDSVINWFQ